MLTTATHNTAAIIIIIITKEYDYGGVMSEDCKDTLCNPTGYVTRLGRDSLRAVANGNI